MAWYRNVFRVVGIGGVLLMGALATVTAQTPTKPATPDSLAFFEKNIRPVLAEKCLSCHGEKSQSASLRLDSRAALLKGGDKGAIVDLTNPEKSHLLEALRYTGSIKMPPSGKLPAQVVADFTAWLTMGAPWPPE